MDYPKYSLGTSVVVECKMPNPSFKGRVEKIMAGVGGKGHFYYVIPDVPTEENLWVAESRLSLAPAYHDDLDSWDAT